MVEVAHSLMKAMDVPCSFWGEVVRTAVHILNRSPTRSLQGVTLYEAWRKKKPAVDYFRTFGCVAHVKLVGPGVTKLADRTCPGIFLGYEPGTKGYRVYDPVSKRLYITRDVRFEEDRRWDWSKDAQDSELSRQRELTVVRRGAHDNHVYCVCTTRDIARPINNIDARLTR